MGLSTSLGWLFWRGCSSTVGGGGRRRKLPSPVLAVSSGCEGVEGILLLKPDFKMAPNKVGACCAAVAVAVYLNTLGAGFVYDDA